MVVDKVKSTWILLVKYAGDFATESSYERNLDRQPGQ
jgi:hypothetical protein